MPEHKYVCTVVVETSERVTKKALRESIALELIDVGVVYDDGLWPPKATITKVRVRAVDID